MKLTFLGAAGTVTGSKYLLESKKNHYLIDCGLFQGLKDLRKRNWEPLSINATDINAVIITHAHIDHSGFLPRLYTLGYRGAVYTTKGTAKLLEILLPDSGYLQEEEAFYANKKGFSKHRPALPLYTKEDAEKSLELLKPQDFDTPFNLSGGEKVTFFRAGHILGASFIRVYGDKKTIVFSGDVGRFNDLIMQPPEILPGLDYLVLESTYGDRKHEDENFHSLFESIINRSYKNKGTILIPAFAVGRAQLILYIVNQLKKSKKIPDLPVYLDSPMSIDATNLYRDFAFEHRLDASLCKMLYEGVKFINTVEESKALKDISAPKIIISASGMASGGRVVHHLANLIGDEKNTVVLVGFQSAGTRGRALEDGVQEIRMFGQYYKVRAKIEYISALSAHADYQDLIRWLKESKITPKKIFLTHGELSASEALCVRIKDTFKWSVTVPHQGDSFEL